MRIMLRSIITTLLILSSLLQGCTSQSAHFDNPENVRKDNINNAEYYNSHEMMSKEFPLSKEPVTLHMMGCRTTANGDWNEMLVFKEYEKITNVKVQFTAISEDIYREKLSVVLGSNQLPDAFIKGMLEPMDVAEYGPNGTLIPLEKLIENHAPNFKKLMDKYPEVKSACFAADGHIYALPAIVALDSARSEKHWINRKWLEKAKVPIPVTTEELKEVLRTFKKEDMNGNGDPDDEIPMTGENIQQIIDNFAGAFGLQKQMMYDININGGKTEIWYGSDKYKMMLQYLSELYREGLLDKDIFFSKYRDFFSKINPDKVGVFHNQTDDIFSQYPEDFIAIAPWKGHMGDQIKNQWPLARDYGAFAITSANKHPEITMKWIDYFYSDQGSLFFRMGLEGKTYVKKPDGTYDYIDSIKNDPRGLAVTVGRMTIWPGRGAPHLINEQNSAAINSKRAQDAQYKLKPYLVERVFPRPNFDIESEKRIRNIRMSLDLYIDASRKKFITGEFTFDEWDKYKNVLERLGIKELEAIYQKAYDSMK